MLIFQFSLYPTHHHLHARGVFNSFFFIITLNLTTITLRPVKRENQLNSHFLLHRLPFYASFFSRCLFIISLARCLGIFPRRVRLHHFLLSRLCVCTFGSATATTIRRGSLTFNHSPRTHSMESKEMKEIRKRIGTGNESRLQQNNDYLLSHEFRATSPKLKLLNIKF